MFDEQLRIVDSLRPYSDLTDAAWQEVRKQISAVGLEGSSHTARIQIATAMLKARSVHKGDYEGHPFRGNQWTDASGVGRGGGSASAVIQRTLTSERRAKVMLAKRPKAIVVDDIPTAIKLMQQGKVVELKHEREINTLLKELHDLAQEAKDKGEDFKINLCNVSVSGTNLFCGAALADKDGNPLPRIKMPQLSGSAREGSEAAMIAQDGEADAGPAFLKFLREHGVGVENVKVKAASLKASQAELVGPKVAAIMDKGKWDKGVVYVSKDGYVIDGHHRWAAAVGADAEDGLGDLKIKVVRVDMPISEVLQVANAFTEEFGIERKKG